MRQVNRPNVKLCLDVPLFKERQSDAFVREAVQACAPHVVLTHYGAWNFKENERGEVVQQHGPSFDGTINYATFVAELQRAGYDGYLVSEYCLPCVENYRIAGIDAVDRATRMGLGFMKQLVATTGRPQRPARQSLIRAANSAGPGRTGRRRGDCAPVSGPRLFRAAR
jgi:sugar phosphate isomerase/epimerase